LYALKCCRKSLRKVHGTSQERGDLSFLEANAGNERKRWACPKCGEAPPLAITASASNAEVKERAKLIGRWLRPSKTTFHNGMVDLPTLKRTNTSMKPE
jgi:hypothetical protein